MAIPSVPTKFFAVLNKHLTDNSFPAIDPAAFVVNAPTVYSGTAYPRNTRLVLDAPLESTSVGRTTVYYDRINLASITGLQVSKGSATTVFELLPAINELMGIALDANDVVNGVLPASGAFNLQASATNLIYTGLSSLNLIA